MKRRDSQRQAVYRWEWALERRFKLERYLTLSECRALIEYHWDQRSRLSPPKITDGRGRRIACYQKWGHLIKLPRALRRPVVVLHETAHGLLSNRYVVAHGREFARLVFDMYCQEFELPRSEVRMLAVHQKPRRVRFATLSQMVKLRIGGYESLK